MTDNEGPLDEKIDFNDAGEVLAYISLDQAVLRARRLVRQDEQRYLERLNWDEIVWTERTSEQREDSYRVVLQFRRPARGLREEQTGEEEFLFNLAGVLEDRQVLLWPESLGADQEKLGRPGTLEPEGTNAHPVTPPSIAEIPAPTPNSPHEGTTEDRSDLLPTLEEEEQSDTGVVVTLPETAEAGHNTSTTEPKPLQCSWCETEYRPGQQFCNSCGKRISDVAVVPPATMAASISYVRPVDRNLEANSPTRRVLAFPWVRKIRSIFVGLWGAFFLLGGGIEFSGSRHPGDLVIIAGGAAIIVSAVLLWPWTESRFDKLGHRRIVIGLIVAGFVAFVAGAVLTSD
jgi:hypothetical protein